VLQTKNNKIKMEKLPLEIVLKIMLYNSTLEADLMRDHPIRNYNNYIELLKKYFPILIPLNFSKRYFSNFISPQPA
jgi:hypothetical protein